MTHAKGALVIELKARRRRNTMIPNIHIYEKLMFQQMHERQRKAAQQRLCKRPRYSMLRLVIGRLGILVLALGTRMKELEVAAD